MCGVHRTTLWSEVFLPPYGIRESNSGYQGCTLDSLSHFNDQKKILFGIYLSTVDWEFE